MFRNSHFHLQAPIYDRIFCCLWRLLNWVHHFQNWQIFKFAKVVQRTRVWSQQSRHNNLDAAFTQLADDHMVTWGFICCTYQPDKQSCIKAAIIYIIYIGSKNVGYERLEFLQLGQVFLYLYKKISPKNFITFCFHYIPTTPHNFTHASSKTIF